MEEVLNSLPDPPSADDVELTDCRHSSVPLSHTTRLDDFPKRSLQEHMRQRSLGCPTGWLLTELNMSSIQDLNHNDHTSDNVKERKSDWASRVATADSATVGSFVNYHSHVDLDMLACNRSNSVQDVDGPQNPESGYILPVGTPPKLLHTALARSPYRCDDPHPCSPQEVVEQFFHFQHIPIPVMTRIDKHIPSAMLLPRYEDADLLRMGAGHSVSSAPERAWPKLPSVAEDAGSFQAKDVCLVGKGPGTDAPNGRRVTRTAGERS